jgi:hypothetical protein
MNEYPGQQPPQYPPYQQYPQYPQPSQYPQYPQQPSTDGPPQYYPQYPQMGSSPQQYYQPPYYAPQQPPQPPKQNSNLWLWIVGAVLLVLVCSCGGVVWAVRSNNSTTTTTSSTAVATQASAPTVTAIGSTPTASQGNNQAASGHHKPGVAVDVTGNTGNWSVTVNNVRANPGDTINTPKSGNQYLLVDVILKNVSSQQQVTSSLLNWKLRDADGQQYTESITTFATPPDGKVEANTQIRGTLAYEVPTGQHNFTLAFDPDIVSGGQTIWDVSI